MTTKADLYRLIDALPEDLTDEAARRLQDLCDDEPLTAEERAGIEEGEAALARGEVISWQEYKRQRAARAG